MMSIEPIVSVIIPTYNRCREVIECVNSVLDCHYKDLEIIIVDNASTDNTLNCLKKKYTGISMVKIIELKRNLMASGGRNAGIKAANGKYLLFLDSDNLIAPLMIDYLVDGMEKNSDIGLIGPLMLYFKDQNRVWFKCNKINYLTSKTTYLDREESVVNKKYPEFIETDHIPNAFMTRKEIVDTIGGFDERYYIMFEEADFAARIRRGGGKKQNCSCK